MDWVERINSTIAYIDDNLSGKICYDKIIRKSETNCTMAASFEKEAAELEKSLYLLQTKYSNAAHFVQHTNCKMFAIRRNCNTPWTIVNKLPPGCGFYNWYRPQPV